MVVAGGGGGEPSAVSAHHFVNNQLACAGCVFIGDVGEESSTFLSGSPSAQGLFDREDVVINRLGHSNDG